MLPTGSHNSSTQPTSEAQLYSCRPLGWALLPGPVLRVWVWKSMPLEAVGMSPAARLTAPGMFEHPQQAH